MTAEELQKEEEEVTAAEEHTEADTKEAETGLREEHTESVYMEDSFCLVVSYCMTHKRLFIMLRTTETMTQ